MAVERRYHGSGIGRRLLEAVEAGVGEDGVEWLQVKTLGPSHPSEEYAKTRRFYESAGYCALEEMHGLWPATPCLVMVKRVSGQRDP